MAAPRLTLGRGPATPEGGSGGVLAMQQSPQEHEYAVLFALPDQGSGPATQTLADRLASRGLQVITAPSREDLRAAVTAHARTGAAPIGAVLVSWDLLGSVFEL